MTKEEWIWYMLKVDDALNAESPRNFLNRKSEERFFILMSKLETEFNTPLFIESSYAIQDSSFHAQAILPSEWLLNPHYTLHLRASNFGNLLAIIDDDQMVKAGIIEVIRRFAKQLDYRLVPSLVLLEKYSGKNKGVDGFHNWMHRYFDWI